MKKVLLVTLLYIGVCYGGTARDFTVVNADGVTLKYIVSSVDNQTLRLASNGYSGRVEVPETVVYNDTTWTVTSVGTAFSNCRGLTYVSLPATVTSLERQAFLDCVRLDTLVFASATPMGIPRVTTGVVYSIFSNSVSYNNRMAIIVPCGSLAAYRRTQWANFRGLRSECAVPLTVLVTEEGVVRVDSILVARNTLHNSNGWYEIGDTAFLKYEWIADDGYQWGWSCGQDWLVVTAPDTVYMQTFRIHWATLNANNISTPISVAGTMSGKDGVANYAVTPDGKSTIYASALWMGGKLDNEVCVAAHKFWGGGTDFGPGPLRVGNPFDVPFSTVQKYNHVWHLTREQIDYHIAHCGEQGYVAIEDILTWPGNGDSADGYAAQLAPYYDADGDGRYNPYAGDYPLIRGDEATFSIFHDNVSHNASQGSSPFFVEVHAMFYAFNEPQDTVLSNTVSAHYELFNRSPFSYNSVYLGAWIDFDIGYSGDDYVGCHVGESLFYGYNSQLLDNGGGLNSASVISGRAPAQGCIFLESPVEANPMSSFMTYDNGSSSLNGDPTSADDYYNYLHAYWKNGQHLRFGGNGININVTDQECNYIYPGQSFPDMGEWDEFTAGNAGRDVRGVGAAGPFSFEAGASCQLTVAHLTAWNHQLTDDVNTSRNNLIGQAPDVRRQWERDTTDSGKPFTHRPYSAPHEVGVAEAAQAEVMLYPNPTTGMLHVRLDSPERQQVQLLDMMGRVVMTATVEGGHATLDLTSLPQGVYILRTGGTAKRIVKK